uniref:F-box domain-containing protein n=1 Tax=Anopheles coluzzii TaxID=1518534 RepID=A0A9I3BDA5_ANOCL
MDRSDAASSLTELPPELIYSIFEHLDLWSLKAVSLTSHRLGEMFSDYCARRLVLSIRDKRTRFIAHPSLRVIAKKVEEATILLESTKRRYRRVHLDVQYDPKTGNIDHMQAVLDKILAVRLMQDLVELKLELSSVSENMAVQLTHTVTKMDSLKELVIREGKSNNPSAVCQLYLVNRSLHKLTLVYIWPGTINCPNLRSLEVVAKIDVETILGKQYALHGNEEPYWKLKHLKEFVIHSQFVEHETVSGNSRKQTVAYRSMFYRHLTQLKKLHIFFFTLPDEVLQAIGESCVQLENLSVAHLLSSNPELLRSLSNLVNLRQLVLSGSNCSVSFDCFCLPYLNRLLLINCNIDWPSLARLQSIKSLMIKLEPSNVNQICDLFVGHMRQLRFLCLQFEIGLNIRQWYREIFAALSKLPELETLVLQTVVELDYLQEMVPLEKLTRLVVYDTLPRGQPVLPVDVAKRVPKVDRIEVPSLEQFSNEMIHHFGSNIFVA